MSRDLISWEHKPVVLEPDQYGTVYSGCGWQYKENAADFGEGCLTFTNPQVEAETIIVPFDQKETLTLDLIIDQEITGFLGNDGAIYGAVETEENILRKKVIMESGMEIASVTFYEICPSTKGKRVENEDTACVQGAFAGYRKQLIAKKHVIKS